MSVLRGMFSVIGRLSTRYAWVIVAFWCVSTVSAVLLLPSLGSVVRNDNSAFLPPTSKSVEAANLASPLVPAGTESGTLVVVDVQGPLSNADQRVVASLAKRVAHVKYVTAVSSGTISSNGEAETILVAFSPATAGGGSAGALAVGNVRSAVATRHPRWLHFYLTGSLPELVDQQHSAAHTARSIGLLSAGVILLLLALAFRSALAPLVALAPAGLALVAAGPLIAESTHVGVEISSLLQLLLTALVLGAGTDYGLFILFRYRENLGRALSSADAITDAVSRVGGTIVYSACTVVVALMSLLLASFGLYRGVGPGLAIGVVVVLAVDLTLLPALLAILGPRIFWPSRPDRRWTRPGIWGSVAARVCRRPIVASITGIAILGSLAMCVTAYAPSGFNPGGEIPGSGSAAGAAALQAYFHTSSANPTVVVFEYRHSLWRDPRVLATLTNTLISSRQFVDLVGPMNPNGSPVSPGFIRSGYNLLGSPQSLPQLEPRQLHLALYTYADYRSLAEFISSSGKTVVFRSNLSAGSSGSTNAMQAIARVRSVVQNAGRVTGANAEGVTGQAAGAADVSAISSGDVVHIVPVVLVLLALLLALGLASVVAPIYMVATVALSFLASLGLSVLIFVIAGHELGVNFSLPFFLFIFIMALGEDYNILVMRRIREESVDHPPKIAVREAISATGSTVTAAGLVLSSTFAVLALATSGQIRQIGTGLSLGILLDTFVVRTLMVPSIAVILGRVNWWPGVLYHTQPTSDTHWSNEYAAGVGEGRDDTVFLVQGGDLATHRSDGYDRAYRVTRSALVVALVALAIVTTVTLASNKMLVPGASTRVATPLLKSNRVIFPTAVDQITSGRCPSPTWCFGTGLAGSGRVVTVAGKPLSPMSVGAWPPGTSLNNQTSAEVQIPPLISCPSSVECVAASGSDAWATIDRGVRWSRSALSGHESRIDSLSCPSPNVCVAAGSSDPYLWTTSSTAAVWISTDGATSWNLAVVPRGFGDIYDVSCTGTLCLALATRSTMPRISDMSQPGISPSSALVSLDSGLTWHVDYAFPALDGNASVTCPRGPGPPVCWAEGMLPKASAPYPITIFSSSNNAQSWRISTAVSLDAIHTITCSQPRACFVVDGTHMETTVDYGRSWNQVALPAGFQYISALTCQDGICFASGISSVNQSLSVALSTDNGLSWQTDAIAAGVQEIGEIACGLKRQCLTTARSNQSLDVMESLNDGRSWTTGVTLPSIGTFAPSVACSASGWCAAFAITGIGQNTTPYAVLAYTTGARFGPKWRLEKAPLTHRQVGGFSTLSCPQPRVCVVALDNGDAAVTRNAGRHWQFVRTGGYAGSFLPSIACYTLSSCSIAFGSEVQSKPSFILHGSENTTTWSLDALPPHIRQISSFTCSPHASCWMLVVQSKGLARTTVGSQGLQGLKLFVQGRGSRTWTEKKLPSGYSVQGSIGMWCSSVHTCWMIVITPQGVRELITSDSGASWYSRKVNVNESDIGWTTCNTPSSCLATNSYVYSAHPETFTLQPPSRR